MKRITRILLSLLAILLLLVVVLAAVVAWDVNMGAEASAAGNVTYASDDGELLGYLAQPADDGPFPAVLLLHEWWGLTEEMSHIADALAAEGYVVLAPDVYRGRVATTVPGALWMRLTTPDEPIWADAEAALAYLRSLESVDSDRVASVGFCFGGEQSLQLGLRQAQALTAVVLFYGSPVTEPAQLAPLAGTPVLGIFGAEDQQIPVAEVRAFEDALESAGIEQTVTVYDGVGHAFLTAENYDDPGAPGEAWQQLLGFLDETVR